MFVHMAVIENFYANITIYYESYFGFVLKKVTLSIKLF